MWGEFFFNIWGAISPSCMVFLFLIFIFFFFLFFFWRFWERIWFGFREGRNMSTKNSMQSMLWLKWFWHLSKCHDEIVSKTWRFSNQPLLFACCTSFILCLKRQPSCPCLKYSDLRCGNKQEYLWYWLIPRPPLNVPMHTTQWAYDEWRWKIFNSYYVLKDLRAVCRSGATDNQYN